MTDSLASKLEIHILTNFTSQLLVAGIQQKLHNDGLIAEVIASNFDQIIQHLSSMPNKSSASRHIFILTRAENLDEEFAVKNSLPARSALQSRYLEFLEAVELQIEQIEGQFYLSSLFEVSESLAFDANDFQQVELKRDLTLRILLDTLSNNNKFHYFNVQSLINLLGLAASWNKSQDLLFRQPFTIELATRLSWAIVERVKQSVFTGIKVIATDGDGTLWGGVIGEDPTAEIEISHDFPGSIFYKYQKFLLDKKIQGILLALVTKNNLPDVYDFFESRKDMPIKLEDFAVIEASWDTKSSALERIAKTINVGLENILFVDDSNFEILEVSYELPQVPSLLLDAKLENRIAQIASLGIKWASGSTVEDTHRTEMIQQNILRDKLISGQASKNLIESLELKLEIASIRDKSDFRLPRILQLINKSNQFNMTCERYVESELIEFLKRGRIYTGTLSDKFGDYGLIAVAMVDFPDQITAHFTNFLVSCRALGRTVEEVLISEIITGFASSGISRILASWRENPKNQQTRDFYSTLGFTSQNDSHLQSENQFVIEVREFVAPSAYIKVTYSKS